MRRIEPATEFCYIQSMLFITNSAVASIRVLDGAFKELHGEVSLEQIETLNYPLILDSLQNLVLQAAAISRYFWPIRNTHEWRGLQLRQAFSLTDEHPLKSRDLRNAIEHFDERLDNYLQGNIVGIFLPEFVGPRPRASGVASHFFRAYFLDEGTFRLLDEEYKIPPLVNSIVEIHNQLITFDGKGGRLRERGGANVS